MEFLFNTFWTDDNEKLCFSMGGGDRSGSYSEGFDLKVQNETKKVCFAWLPGKKFQILDWDSDYALAEGTYQGSGLSVTLNFTKDEIWGDTKTLLLKGGVQHRISYN